MKMILAMLLVLMMVMAMTSVAMAADENITGYVVGTNETSSVANGGSFNLTKNYTVTGTNAVNPADTIQFTVDNAAFENAGVGSAPSPVPVPTIANVAVAQGSANATVAVQLPTYTVPGVYTYQIHETDTNKAGVTYLSDALYLKVTAINKYASIAVNGGAATSYPVFADGTNEYVYVGGSYYAYTASTTTLDTTTATAATPTSVTASLIVAGIAVRQGAETGDKIDEFENKYDAGTLLIDKTVTGNMGDTSKVWNFTVTLVAPEGDTVNAPITIASTSTYTSLKQGTSEVPRATGIAAGWTGTKTLALQLTHGQNIKLENLPAGVTYTVAETESGDDGYTTTGEVSTATAITANGNATVNITNTKNLDVDTGVSLDTVPYIMIMALAFAGIIVLMSKKRREQN